MIWPQGAFRVMFQRDCENEGDIVGHMPFLYGLAVSINAQQIIELGVREGNSTIAFLAALEQTGGKLWSCDKEAPVFRAADLLNRVPFWTFHRMPDQVAIELVPPSCDILFIDTSHTYEQTLSELHNYSPLVRPGGYMLLHDTELSSVREALWQWDWHEKNYPNWTGMTFEHSHGLGVYRRCA